MAVRRVTEACYDAVVAGAGVAGSATARDIGRAGFRVLLVEEHPQVGLPTHCSGLVTPRCLDLAGTAPGLVVNAISGAMIHSATGGELVVDDGRTRAYAIDRPRFDQALADAAQRAGAELAVATKLRGVGRRDGCLLLSLRHREREMQVRTRLLIGADGAQSRVASATGAQSLESAPLVGLGAEVRLQTSDTNLVQVFAGGRVAPGFFAWLIPLGAGRARLGVATNVAANDGKRPIHYLRDLIAGFPQFLRGVDIVRLYGGLIPLRRLSRIYSDRCLLIGDAAGQVKPTSGGGIYTALVAASCCSRTAVRCLRADRLDAGSLSAYQRDWHRAMGKELERGWDLRRAMLGLSDGELDGLLQLLGTPALRRLILRHGDIDFPSSFAARLVTRHPWLLRLARGGIRASW